MPEKMDILLRGFYGWGNLGDDLLYLVTRNIVEEALPGQKIEVFSGNPNEDQAKYLFKNPYKVENIVFWHNSRFFDLEIYGGGGIFFDLNRGSYLFKWINWLAGKVDPRKLFITEGFFRWILGKHLPIKTKNSYAIGISLGSYTSGSKRYLKDRSRLGKFDFIMVRDQFSFQLLRQNGYRSTLLQGSDMVFDINRWPFNIKIKKEVNKIGFVVLDWYNVTNNSFIERINQSIRDFRNQGYQVEIFSFHASGDQKMAKTIENIIFYQPENIQEFLTQFASCEYIISGRFHGIVLGALFDCYCIPMKISRKIVELAKQLEIEDYLVDYSNIDSEAINMIKNESIKKPIINDVLKKAEYTNRSIVKNLREGFLE
jgi:polysaccharide pyruvyl transferase WcaK-like protein